MLEILQRIFEEHYYTATNDLSTENSIFFQSNKRPEFYILSKYTEEDLKDYFQCEQTQSLLNKFENIYTEKPLVKKNTAQVILVKTNGVLNSLKKLKNYIFRAEEDEFFVKKYIILYSEESLLKLAKLIPPDIDSIHKKLLEIVYDNKSFENYWNKDLKNIEESDFEEFYFLVLQLFIKLPFLAISKEEKSYRSPADQITDQLKEHLKVPHKSWLEDPEYFKESILTIDENLITTTDEGIDESLSQLHSRLNARD
jgi:hypothetical protein